MKENKRRRTPEEMHEDFVKVYVPLKAAIADSIEKLEKLRISYAEAVQHYHKEE